MRPENPLVWYCIPCGNVTPRHPATKPEDMDKCSCGQRNWGATDLKTANQKRLERTEVYRGR